MGAQYNNILLSCKPQAEVNIAQAQSHAHQNLKLNKAPEALAESQFSRICLVVAQPEIEALDAGAASAHTFPRFSGVWFRFGGMG